MKNTYTTVSGDTWDTIARAAYGDEFKADHLMKERGNIALLDYQVFPAGITVLIPEITEKEAYEDNLPDWRKD